MNEKLTRAAWESDQAGSNLLVLLCLAFHSDCNGQIYAHLDRLADKCNLSVRQTQRILRQLEARGYVKMIQKEYGQTPRCYSVRMPL